MAKTHVLAGRILASGSLFEGWVEVRGGTVAEVGRGRAPRRAAQRAHVVAPGLVDLQVNGACGHEVVDGHRALDVIDRALLQRGVTSYLPTIITTTDEAATTALGAIAERAADPTSPVAGAHLEGPFLAPKFRGVHRRELLSTPRRGEPAWYRSPAVRLVTIAPELPGTLDLIDALRSRRVTVSVGHTGASADQIEAALERGASSVTHLFNAMRPLEQRSPNAPGVALTDPRVTVCVIPDGVHVDPRVLRLVARAAGGRVVLVTDSTPAAGAPDGTYRMAGIDIRRDDGRVEDAAGRLAGSAITLDEAVERWVHFTGSSLPHAWTAASERPARLARIRHGLRTGMPADLVLLNEEQRVERVMKAGAWVP